MSESIAGIDRALCQVFFSRFPTDAVRHLEQMSTDDIVTVLSEQPLEKTMNIWMRLSPQLAAQILMLMPISYAASLMKDIDPNRGAGILRSIMDTDKRKEIIDATDPHAASDLKRALAFEPETAGALMESRVMYFRPDMTVREVLGIIRTRPRGMYRKIYTVDQENKLHAVFDIEDLALADPDEIISDLNSSQPIAVEVNTGREELVGTFEKYKLTDLPVVDYDGHLVGVLRYHVLVEAALKESSADLQTMVGVSKDERALSPASFAVRKRQPWLQINLATAFLAAAVVGMFEGTIAQYTALAVLLPVVAGQSGNTGAQALAVTLRGLALKEIYPRMWLRVTFKEFYAGFWNGLAVAFTTAIAVYIWSQSEGLTMVIFLSMILSMIVAGVFGAIIPIMLTVTGQDPAQSSSIFLTTVTDVAGFFSFLGIATLFISML